MVTAGSPPAIPDLTVVEREDHQEIEVYTELADYLLSTQGGLLKSVYLHFAPIGTQAVELIPETETKPHPQTGALERSYVRDARFPFQLIIDGESDVALSYSFESQELDRELLVRLTAEIGDLRVVKTFTFSENPYYSVIFKLELINLSDEDLALSKGAAILLGNGVGSSKGAHDQIRYLFGGDVTDRPLESPDLDGLGFVGRGLVFFLKKLSAEEVFPLKGSEDPRTTLGLEIPSLVLEPHGSRIYAFELYTGRAKYTLLAHEGLGELDPPGFFAQFLIPVVQLLDWLYRTTGNYGWAIILFTLITRILLFPLTRKQFHSMAVMAELKPKIDKLQQRYPTLKRLRELHPNLSQEELIKRDRENRRALQEKLMELYRKEGVNPLGGCLPMLIQFPILIILWRAIFYSAETIHLSPGFLWMSDLSLRDPYYLIVALTAIAMLLQTKTTPTVTTTSSQGPNPMVFMFLSIGIMVLFLKDFPSGLWLYYFLTTIIQVAQQLFINWELKHIRLRKKASAGEADSQET